jgi:hypothetical protein
MAGLEFFDRELRIATADLEPDAINAALAKFARQELAKANAGGASPEYERYVNGRHGAVEETVQAPGPIVYEFINWPLIINAAVEELQKRSPRPRSGRFASSFIVIVGGSVTTDFRSIRLDAEVIITNFQPYVRKVEGGKRLGQKRVFDSTKNSLVRRFGSAFAFQTKFLNIGSGVHPEIPYILKGGGARRRAAQNSRSSAFRAGREFLATRSDRQPGQPISYPSIVINAL